LSFKITHNSIFSLQNDSIILEAIVANLSLPRIEACSVGGACGTNLQRIAGKGTKKATSRCSEMLLF